MPDGVNRGNGMREMLRGLPWYLWWAPPYALVHGQLDYWRDGFRLWRKRRAKQC